MSIGTQCSHNIPWSGYCKECEIVSLKETIRFFDKKVINAKQRLKELGADEIENTQVNESYFLQTR